MDFKFNEDQREFKALLRQFVDNEIIPVAREWEQAGRYPTEIVEGMKDMGLFGITVPEEYGGLDLDPVSFGLVFEEIARGWMGIAGILGSHSLACRLIAMHGTEEQKSKYLPDLATGKRRTGIGLTEADAGTDLQGIRTTARLEGDHYVINGSKMWITNAPMAHIAIVWAHTEDGIQGFVIEKGTPGFTVQEIKKKMSLRASATGALFFDNVRVPDANRLPNVKGLKGPLGCLTQARYGITWGPIGAAQACLEEVLAYTKERILFGRPVAATQSAQIKMADMARRITAAQLLSLQLGRLKEAGKMEPTQVSLAKWNNCRMAIDIARECRDLLGGAGITTEHAAIRHALNLESVITYEGTETVHQLVVGRELTGINAF